MSKNREDISDWAIHFIHNRNIDANPGEYYFEVSGSYSDIPDSFSYSGQPQRNDLNYGLYEWNLEPDASAFTILKRILYNGFIKATWSFRNSNATIYGPKPAVCFTEMPLNSLLKYVKSRRNTSLVNSYGIAFLRSELFRAGARPVIYGLSTPHEEADVNDANYGIGLRTLATNCGIGLKEQYRYVATNFRIDKPIDWTHEREWRWADTEERFFTPGLPFLLKDTNASFSKIFVIVQTEQEAKQIVDELKRSYDAKYNNFDEEYSLRSIENTIVLPIDNLEKLGISLDNVKLDDLVTFRLPKIKKVIPNQEILEKVKAAWLKANEISKEASEKAFNEWSIIDKVSGMKTGLCGFADLVTHDSHSEVTQALLKLGIAEPSNSGYHIYSLETYPTQIIDIHEAGAHAAADYLSKELRQHFFMKSKLD